MNEDSNEAITDLDIIQPSAIEHLTKAEIDCQIATARKYPRSIKSAMNRMIELATVTRATASSSFYRLPRREWDEATKTYVNKVIEGPSIRLAEMAASAFGNLRFGARVVEIGHDRIVAQGFCADLETNNACAVEVSGSILTKKGKRYVEHMITTTANALCSKALRNAVFRIIPRSYVDQVLRECKQVAIGKGMTMIERWKEIRESYSRHGVDEKKLLMALGRKGVADVTTDDLVHLHGLLTSIDDGEITAERALRPEGEDGIERSTVADELTDQERVKLEQQRQEDEELQVLVRQLSEIDAEAVENVTRSAPSNAAALVELRKLRDKVEKSRGKKGQQNLGE
jgi:hypothetical protein